MKCSFCEDAMTTVKWSSQENLEAEMDDILALGYRGVYIFDDLFSIAMPKVQPICEALKKRDLWYRCNGQAHWFTFKKWGKDFAQLLASTGCKEIAFGHESGSQIILDNIKKETTVNENYLSVKYAKDAGIRVKSFLMIGLPGENKDTIKETEKFLMTSGIDDAQIAVFYPYKGTQIRDAIDRGHASQDIEFVGEGLGAYGQKGGSSESVIRTNALSSEELLQERDRLVNLFKPKSHSKMWNNDDRFFDTNLVKP